MKYYIIKMLHNDFKCKINNELKIDLLVNNFIKNQNKGQSKSDKIHLKSIKKITEEEYNKSILYDETYKLT